MQLSPKRKQRRHKLIKQHVKTQILVFFRAASFIFKVRISAVWGHCCGHYQEALPLASPSLSLSVERRISGLHVAAADGLERQCLEDAKQQKIVPFQKKRYGRK